MNYEARTLLRLGVVPVADMHWCQTPTPIITLNYIILSNYYWCWCVCVVSDVRASYT